MRMSGISKNVFPFLIVFFSLNDVFGQCTLQCGEDDCGGVTVAFGATGNQSIFCEGASIPLENNTDTAQGFDYYVVDWADGGTPDTFYTEQTAIHTYTLDDSVRCEGNKTFWVCFKGVKECSEGISCHIGAYQFTIKPRPKAIINLQSQYCITDAVFFSESSCNEDTYAWDFGDGGTSTMSSPSHTYSSAGPKNIRLIVTNECGADTAYQQIVIVENPLAQVSWDTSDDTICIDQIVSLTDVTTTYGGATWTFPPIDSSKWQFTDTLMNATSNFIAIHFKQQGTYTYRLVANNACGTDVQIITIVVLDGPTLAIIPGPDLCIDNAIYDPESTFTNPTQIQSYQWTFTGGSPSSSTNANPGNVTYTSAGTFPVILVIQSPCGPSTDTTYVTVDNIPVITMPSGPFQYCSGSMPDTLVAQPMGGVWTGQGISSNGIFDPGSVPPGATYTLTYTAQNGECVASSTITVNVVSSETVTVEDAQQCQDSAPFNLVATPAGGIWSDTTWLSSNGLFNPTISGTGIFNPVYHYLDINGCMIDVSPTVIIQSFPVSMMTDTSVLCNENIINSLSEVLQLTLTPSGGDTTWLVNGMSSNGTINGMGLTGFYQVDLMYSFEACSIIDSAVIEFITPVPLQLSDDTIVCIYDGTYQVQSNLSGSWSGAGIDPSTGIIDLAIAGAGAHTFAFVHQPGTSCEQTDNVLVTINDPGISLSAGADVSLCFGVVTNYTFSGASPAGGIWSGAGIVDPITGRIDVTLLVPDSVYTYSYCLEDPMLVSCMACDEVEVIVHSLPVADFSINGTTCINTPFNLTVDTCDVSSVYSWNFGDGNMAAGCSVGHTYSIAGDYLVSANVVSQFGCTDSHDLNVHVTAPPLALFNLVDDEGCAPFLIEIINMSSGEIDQQLWIIGGDTISGINPGMIIIDGLTADSLIPIVLQVSNGCAIVSHLDSILVHPYPVVDFGFNVDEGCSPLLIEFGNATLGNPENWFWDLGNGMISSDSIPAPQIYTTPADSVSIYIVELISTNACGADTLTQNITVYPPDVTAFIQLDTITGCQPLSVSAHSFSTQGSIIGWQVIGPDGQVTGSTDSDPVFVLDQAGQHMIILTAARCGMDFDTAFVDVLPAPVIDFEIDPIICQEEVVLFENLSQDVTGVLWDFGDGGQTTDFNPVYSYPVPGVYTVTLTANSLVNNCPNSKTVLADVLPKPLLQIDTQPQSGCPPYTIPFLNTGPQDISYVWLFDDGSPLDTAFAPVHTYTQSGTFTVEVFAYDNFGCISDTVNVPVTIHPMPESRFDILSPRYCERHDTIFTQNNSLGASSYYWIVNGDITGTDPLVYLPDTYGLNTISLVAENSFGCRDTSTSAIEILPSPTAVFQISDNEGCAPLTSDFINNSIGSTNYLWDFGDGNTSLDFTPAHTFSDSGLYVVALIASHSNGCPNDTATTSVNVFPVPIADFDFDKAETCGVPMNVFFTNQSIGGLDYTWTFGDGQGSDVTQPNHTYTTDGDFVVDLLVKNNHGCRDSVSTIVEIYQQPVAGFSIPVQILCEDAPIDIINQSSHAISYCWFLNDELISETTDLELSIPEPGIYTLSLVAKYNSLCQDTMTLAEDIEVYINPHADFTYEVDQQESILGDVQFQNLSDRFDRLNWDFGDGNSSADLNPFHEYDINRDIEVILYAFNDNGGIITCIDTISKNIAPEWLVTFFAPNAFSPDYGEELVRVFKPVGIGLAEYEISVYSPWGQRVWHSTAIVDHHPSESWNGQLDNTGEHLPQGAFTWLAKVEFVNGDSRVYKGSVTLLR